MNYGLGFGSFADGFMAGQDMRRKKQQSDADEAMRARMDELLSGDAKDSTPKPAFTGSSSIDPAQQVAQVQANEAQSASRQMPAFTGSDSMSQVSDDAKRQQELAQQRAAQSQSSSAGQGQGISPSAGIGIAKSFMGGGAAGGSGASAGGAGGAGGAAAGSSAGGSSAAGGLGGAAASAGPWAALAAVVAVNEYNAKKGGFRAENDKEYAKDLATGKVMSQDINGRWAPKLFGSSDKMGLGADMKAGGEASHLDLNGTIDNLKNGTVGKLIKKIF